jgi:hypothetical protein
MLFLVILALFGLGFMVLSAAYAVPEGIAHGNEELVELGLLFGGLLFGQLVGLRVIAYTKRLASPATRERWEQQLRDRLAKLPYPLRLWVRFIHYLGR